MDLDWVVLDVAPRQNEKYQWQLKFELLNKKLLLLHRRRRRLSRSLSKDNYQSPPATGTSSNPQYPAKSFFLVSLIAPFASINANSRSINANSRSNRPDRLGCFGQLTPSALPWMAQVPQVAVTVRLCVAYRQSCKQPQCCRHGGVSSLGGDKSDSADLRMARARASRE